MTLHTRLSKVLLLVATAVATPLLASGMASAADGGSVGPAVAAPQLIAPLAAPPGLSGALAPTRTGQDVDTLTGLPASTTPPPVTAALAPKAVTSSPSAQAAATPRSTQAAAASPLPAGAEPVAPPSSPAGAEAVATPSSVDVHDTRDKNKVEVEVDRGAAGKRESVELDLPSLKDENEKIKGAVPEAGDAVAGAEPEFDIPIVVNRKVERWLSYYQTVGRKHMVVWLARSERYIPMMQAILKEKGLPSDLVYLALIESGFSTRARSHASAVGPWQFIQGTARRYGLRVDWWIDERQDPERSTVAAADYLSDLHDMFGSWYLAAAGYNAGEGRIVRAIARFDTDDFWEIAERRYLAAETREYVPKLIAAALIAKSPEKYGFADVDYQEPLVYDKVEVPDATDLAIIARAAEVDYEEVKALNPELRRWATPPNYPGYQVKIPLGKKEVFAKHFGGISPSERITYRRHIVRSGDTLSHVASRYGVGLDQVRRLNNLRGNVLRVGQSLVVPVPADRSYIARGSDADQEVKPGRRMVAASKRTPARMSPKLKAASAGERTIRYRVRRGDTLTGLAERHDVSLSELRRWNNLPARHVLKAGERLVIKVSGDS